MDKKLWHKRFSIHAVLDMYNLNINAWDTAAISEMQNPTIRAQTEQDHSTQQLTSVTLSGLRVEQHLRNSVPTSQKTQCSLQN